MKLIKSPNPVLKQSAEDWDFAVDLAADKVETEMISLMQSNNGIGLAANQVGLLKRVFVIQLQIHTDITRPLAMFNPRVINQSIDEQTGEEGCLSFPDLWLDVKRPKSITAAYLDKTGKEYIIELNGIDTRCFLHELDHLNGTCFTEKISPLKLALAIKKQRKRNG